MVVATAFPVRVYFAEVRLKEQIRGKRALFAAEVGTTKMKRTLITIIAIASLAVGAWAQAPAAAPAKNFKDQAEYGLYNEIIKPELTPAVRLQTLDKWKAGYAQSEYSDVRLKIYLITYQQLMRHREAIDTALEILKTDANDMSALTEIVGYGLTLMPTAANAPLTAQNKTDLDTIDKTGRYVIANIDAMYAADKKPAGMTDPQWAAAKPVMRNFAQFTVARAAVTSKDAAKAEAELAKTLEMDATNAQASYALAGVLLGQQKDHPEKMPLALYQYARASQYDGPGSMDAATRKQVDTFLGRAYGTFHGSAQGLDQLKTLAKTAVLPPAGFSIKSTVDIAKDVEEKRQAAAKANPMLAFWGEVKEGLTGDNSAMYWESVKDAALPGGANGVMKFKGKLISATPETKPKELTIAISGEVAEVTLKLDEPLPGKMDLGGELSFSGTAKEFTKEPFMLTFEVEPANVEGWTGKGAPGARPAGAGKKGAPAAKKK